jgi:nucleotide-binding universal stress UspA family protein
MKRILVPVDGSPGATRAAAFASKLAKDSGADIHLVHVYDAPTAVQLGLRALDGGELDEARSAIGRGSFANARTVIDGTIAEELVLLGHPVEEICGHAQKLRADLIVMGTRGMSPFKSALLGSVSDGVIRHAHCPVTVVR